MNISALEIKHIHLNVTTKKTKKLKGISIPQIENNIFEEEFNV